MNHTHPSGGKAEGHVKAWHPVLHDYATRGNWTWGHENEHMDRRNYNICPDNTDGKHAPIVANIDLEIADTHVSVACSACGTTTGWPIAEFVDRLEWN